MKNSRSLRQTVGPRIQLLQEKLILEERRIRCGLGGCRAPVASLPFFLPGLSDGDVRELSRQREGGKTSLDSALLADIKRSLRNRILLN